MRLHFTLVLAHALACLSASAAPVPKRPVEPPALTVDLMIGDWFYEWSQYKDGCIIFNKDGTYGAGPCAGFIDRVLRDVERGGQRADD